MSELEAYVLVIGFIGIIFVVPVALIYIGIMRKWRASVALSPAERKKAGEFAAARFDDPLASRIEWVPLSFAGSPQRGHTLVRTGPQRLEFRMISNPEAPKRLLIMLAVVFLVPGYLVLVEGAELAHAVSAVFIVVFGIGLLILLPRRRDRK